MSNFIPQNPANNAAWTTLQNFTRNLALQGKELFVYTGEYGSSGTISVSGTSDQINVPTNIWTVILILDHPGQGPTDVTAETPLIVVNVPNGPLTSDSSASAWAAPSRQHSNRSRRRPAISSSRCCPKMSHRTRKSREIQRYNDRDLHHRRRAAGSNRRRHRRLAHSATGNTRSAACTSARPDDNDEHPNDVGLCPGARTEGDFHGNRRRPASRRPIPQPEQFSLKMALKSSVRKRSPMPAEFFRLRSRRMLSRLATIPSRSCTRETAISPAATQTR